MTQTPFRLRSINPDSASEIAIVAQRMRQTLMEVLGEEEGKALYSMDWLEDRVRFHLDPARSEAAVFVAENAEAVLLGHCIVRREVDDSGEPFGLFSTTFVAPEFRRQGLAEAFLKQGEAWMRERGLPRAATDTARHNVKLIRLYTKYGYEVVYTNETMLRLAKTLEPGGS